MNRNPIQVDQKSLQRLNMNFDEFARELHLVCKEALKHLGQDIITDAQTRLKRGKKNVTSALITSGATKEAADGAILAGFSMIYAYYVEYGRRAGKMPPFRFIYEWVKQRHMVRPRKKEEREGLSKKADVEMRQKQMAYAIQHSIGKKGTKPFPFLRPAFEKRKRTIEAVLKKGAAKVMNKDYTR